MWQRTAGRPWYGRCSTLAARRLARLLGPVRVVAAGEVQNGEDDDGVVTGVTRNDCSEAGSIESENERFLSSGRFSLRRDSGFEESRRRSDEDFFLTLPRSGWICRSSISHASDSISSARVRESRADCWRRRQP